MGKKTIIQSGILLLLWLGVAVGFYEGCKSVAQGACEVGVLAFMAQARPDIYMKLDDAGAVDNFTNTYCKDVLRFQ